jgi:hypothetical protein
MEKVGNPYARLFYSSYAKYLQVRTWCIQNQNVCLFSNVTSRRNLLLLFVKHLAMHILTKKYRIRLQYSTANKISGRRGCLPVIGAHRATEQLTLWPYHFKQCNSGSRLQEFSITIGSVILCMARCMHSSACILCNQLTAVVTALRDTALYSLSAFDQCFSNFRQSRATT